MEQITRKKGIMIYLSAIMVVLFAMLGLRDCSRSGGYFAVKAGGDTIDVLIEYAPLTCYSYNDTLGGFDYDLLTYILSDHGVTYKMHPITSLNRALTAVADGDADLLVADLPVTSEYRQRFRFARPVRIDRQVLVQRRDSVSGMVPIASQLDLANDTVWVVAGSTVGSRIVNLAHEIGDTIYVKTIPDLSSELLFLMVASGQIERAVVSDQVAARLARQYDSIDISTNISLSQFQSWIVGSRCQWLADSMDVWLDSVISTPYYVELCRRYDISGCEVEQK